MYNTFKISSLAFEDYKTALQVIALHNSKKRCRVTGDNLIPESMYQKALKIVSYVMATISKIAKAGRDKYGDYKTRLTIAWSEFKEVGRLFNFFCLQVRGQASHILKCTIDAIKAGLQTHGATQYFILHFKPAYL